MRIPVEVFKKVYLEIFQTCQHNDIFNEISYETRTILFNFYNSYIEKSSEEFLTIDYYLTMSQNQNIPIDVTITIQANSCQVEVPNSYIQLLLQTDIKYTNERIQQIKSNMITCNTPTATANTISTSTYYYNSNIGNSTVDQFASSPITTTSTIYPYYNYITIPSTGGESENKEEKENKKMNIPSMKFDFGPVNSDVVAMSPYGLAIKPVSNQWIAYDTKKNQTIDVTGMVFDFKGMIYKVPVAINQIQVGDLIIHRNKGMYVTGIQDATHIEVIDLAASEEKVIIPVSNIFGFNYITKVVSFFNFGNITPSAENPFGNIIPMMMMSSLFDDDKNKTNDNNDFMKMMFMISMRNGETNPFATMFAGFAPKTE